MVDNSLIGGRLRHFLPFWRKITGDYKVLNMIKGVKFDFVNKICQKKFPKQIAVSREGREFMHKKISELLANGSIEQISTPDPEGWVSNVFLVPKKDGGFRMILNLKALNSNIRYQKFKMDHIHDVLNMIEPNMLLCSLDITSAFNQVYVHPAHHRYLSFQWEDKYYRFKCLPQGATCSPRIFVRITTPVMKFLRSQMVRIMIYIDDTLIMANTFTEMSTSMRLTVDLLEKAGFVLNYPKSQMNPTTSIDFLGFTINTLNYTVSLTEGKLNNLIAAVKKLRRQKTVSIRELARVIGKIVATFPSCSTGPLHYRVLECYKIKMLRLKKGKYSAKIPLNHSCLQELDWWCNNLNKNIVTRSLHAVEISQHIYTDSTLQAFGGCWGDRTIQSHFSEQQSGLSINTKELLAILYTLSAFASLLQGENVLVHCDNTVAVSCIRKLGSKDALKDKIVREIFDISHKYKFTLQCTWLSTKANSRADRLSRKLDLNPRLEWSIPKDMFHDFCAILKFEPDIDLFASHLNSKCTNYCSRMTDPHSIRVDAFTLNWSKYCPYIFPPFRLIHRILRKIDADHVQWAMMVVPLHTSQSWFPKFMALCTKPLVLLPRVTAKKLFLPWDSGIRHPLVRNLRLILGDLCSNFYQNTMLGPGRQVKLQTMAGDPVLLKDIQHVLEDGATSVKKRKLINMI